MSQRLLRLRFVWSRRPFLPVLVFHYQSSSGLCKTMSKGLTFSKTKINDNFVELFFVASTHQQSVRLASTIVVSESFWHIFDRINGYKMSRQQHLSTKLWSLSIDVRGKRAFFGIFRVPVERLNYRMRTKAPR